VGGTGEARSVAYMNRLQRDLALRERYRAIEARTPLVPKGHANVKGALDEIGDKLVRLLKLHDQQTRNLRELYLRYLSACEANGADAKPYRPGRHEFR